MKLVDKLPYGEYKVKYLEVYRDETVDHLAEALYYARRHTARREDFWRRTAIVLAMASLALVLAVV